MPSYLHVVHHHLVGQATPVLSLVYLLVQERLQNRRQTSVIYLKKVIEGRTALHMTRYRTNCMYRTNCKIF